MKDHNPLESTPIEDIGHKEYTIEEICEQFCIEMVDHMKTKERLRYTERELEASEAKLREARRIALWYAIGWAACALVMMVKSC